VRCILTDPREIPARSRCILRDCIHADDNDIQPLTCTCASFQQTRDRCKHMFLVERYTSQPDASGKGSRNDSDTGPSDLDNDSDEGSLPSGSAICPTATSMSAADSDGDSEGDSPTPGPEAMEEVMEDVLYDRSSGMPSTDRVRSESPPPPRMTQREERHFLEGKAIQENWNDLLTTLYNTSIGSQLAINHDQERMRNMVAQLQSMISTWPEALGQRAPNASQRR
jgi:hypothetical protein